MRAGQGCAGRRGKTPGVGQPWGTARVGNTSQNHGGKAGRCVGRLSEGQLPARPSSLSGCCRLLSLLAQLRLCCARQPPQPLTATSTPSTLQTLLQHGDSHQDTATLLPRQLQPSPALALQQPFDPRCSNAAEDAFCTGPPAVCRPNPPQIFERKATEKAGYQSAQ